MQFEINFRFSKIEYNNICNSISYLCKYYTKCAEDKRDTPEIQMLIKSALENLLSETNDDLVFRDVYGHMKEILIQLKDIKKGVSKKNNQVELQINNVVNNNDNQELNTDQNKNPSCTVDTQINNENNEHVKPSEDVFSCDGKEKSFFLRFLRIFLIFFYFSLPKFFLFKS